jgi:hypothetical protein
MQYSYLLIDPHKPGILGVKGVFHRKYEAVQFAKRNGYSTKNSQLFRVSSNLHENIMTCYQYRGWCTPC